MISPDIDLGKTKTLLLYLGIAKHKLDQREFAKQKLSAQISQLKKISTSSIKKHVEELEKDIADALVKEKKIHSVQQAEAEHHKKLIGKIDQLEKKLGKYLETKESRKKHIMELEEKIKKKTSSRQEQLKELQSSIKKLEKLYSEAKKDKSVSKVRLKSIQSKIKKLKKEVKAKL